MIGWDESELQPVEPEQPPKDVPAPIALVFPSRSGNANPHVVIVLDVQPVEVSCTCPAIRSLEYRPLGCWAMQRAREMLGI